MLQAEGRGCGSLKPRPPADANAGEEIRLHRVGDHILDRLPVVDREADVPRESRIGCERCAARIGADVELFEIADMAQLAALRWADLAAFHARPATASPGSTLAGFDSFAGQSLVE